MNILLPNVFFPYSNYLFLKYLTIYLLLENQVVY